MEHECHIAKRSLIHLDLSHLNAVRPRSGQTRGLRPSRTFFTYCHTPMGRCMRSSRGGRKKRRGSLPPGGPGGQLSPEDPAAPPLIPLPRRSASRILRSDAFCNLKVVAVYDVGTMLCVPQPGNLISVSALSCIRFLLMKYCFRSHLHHFGGGSLWHLSHTGNVRQCRHA